jgi:hypothetical protein
MNLNHHNWNNWNNWNNWYNWYKKAQVQYHYVLNCTNLKHGKPIQDMIDEAEDISWEEFNKYISNQELRSIFGDIYDYDNQDNKVGLKIQDDYAVSFHKSFFQGVPCYYLVHSAIEYIFLPGDTNINELV